MKFRVTMKDPDTLDDSIRDAVRSELKAVSHLDELERGIILDHRIETVMELCRRWFADGECLTVEIDTTAGTCTVVSKP